jgi:hypothetical protein
MVVEAARVSMQDGDRAGAALELAVVGGEGAYRLPGTVAHQVVDGALVLPGQGAYAPCLAHAKNKGTIKSPCLLRC